MGGRISHSITLSLTLDQVRGLPANHCPPPTWGVGEQNEVMQKEREDKGNRGDPHKTARGGGVVRGLLVSQLLRVQKTHSSDRRASHAMSE